MAACLRILPLVYSAPSFASSSNSQSLKRRSLRIHSSSIGAKNSAKISFPPLNPNDPFLSKLASVAANAPENLLDSPVCSDKPPFLDLFGGPQPKAAIEKLQAPKLIRRRRRRMQPPDLPSVLLDARIVYIGMPLVPAVVELIIEELLYLLIVNSGEPIYLYINSTGTARDDGQPVGLEASGFAIYDVMSLFKSDIYTVCVGVAVGQACLLLAAGTKGKRYMFPHTKAMLRQPRVTPTGLMPATDVVIRGKEAIANRDILRELLAKHTGNSVETIAKRMDRPFYMDAEKAKAFGVIDKVIYGRETNILPHVRK